MAQFTTRESVLAIEAKGPWETLDVAKSIYQLLGRTTAAHGAKNAVSFQLTSARKIAAKRCRGMPCTRG